MKNPMRIILHRQIGEVVQRQNGDLARTDKLRGYTHNYTECIQYRTYVKRNGKGHWRLEHIW